MGFLKCRTPDEGQRQQVEAVLKMDFTKGKVQARDSVTFVVNSCTMKVFILLVAFCFCLSANGIAQEKTCAMAKISIRFENLESGKGYIRLALYDSKESFMDESQAVLHDFKVKNSGSMEVQIPDLEKGRYAFAVFHDLNSDNELSTNFFGIPTEPYGFSRPSVSKWRPPTFEEAAFDLKDGEQQLTVTLQRWKL